MLDIRNTCVAEYTGVISLQAIEDAMLEARELGSVLSLDVLVPADDFSTYRSMLERNGFMVSGTVTRGTPETQMFVRFRKGIRTAGDGIVSNGEAVSVGRSPQEQAAIDTCLARFRNRQAD